MADETKQELGRRAVACKGWRWMPGMLAPLYGRIYAVSNAGIEPRVWTVHEGQGGRDSADAAMPAALIGLPDLDDPATLGCLLALVREAWDNPTWTARFLPWLGHWAVEGSDTWGATEAEALVAALEAAP